MSRLFQIATIAFVSIFMSCSADELDLSESPSRVVIEGWLTDQDTIQQIKLSRSIAFADQTAPPAIENALRVQVTSNISESYNFVHEANGIYKSVRSFAGVSGISYTLEVLLADGREINSTPEVMKSAPNIDSLGYIPLEVDTENNDEVELAYYPIVYTSDKAESEDFYRWKLFRNDTLFDDPVHIVLLNDRFFNGKDYFNEFTAFEYAPGDEIKVELLEISRGAYRYLGLLKAQTTTIGTVSAVSPGPIPGNLFYVASEEDVLGYWGPVSVQLKSITISE